MSAALIGLAQFGVLAINAVSRQVVQNLELRPHFEVLARESTTQLGPLAMFLVAFVLGLGVVAWMVAQVARAPAGEAT